jgi:hypothetical protein
MNFCTRKAAAVTASAFVPVVVTWVGLSQKAAAKAQQVQAAWSAPTLSPTQPSTCYAFHKGTGPLSTLGENGLTNGLCYVGDKIEAHGKHLSKGIEVGLESLGNAVVAAAFTSSIAVVAAAFILS